jgi:tetratricopeptide (TPR) repeat protein
MLLRVDARIAKFLFVAMATAIAGCASENTPSIPGTTEQNGSLESVLKAGDRARSAGDLASAEAFYEQVTVIDAGSIEGWLRFGAVQVLSGKFNAAIPSYRAAQKLDASNIEAAYALAQIALRDGRAADAIAEIGTALKSHPDDPQLNYIAWIAYTRLGQFEVAPQYYRTAITHDGHHLLARNTYELFAVQGNYEPTRESEPSEAQIQPPLRTETNALTIAAPIGPLTIPRPTAAPDQQVVDQNYRLQLGSERSDVDAREEWNRLLQQHPQILSDVSLTIEKADLGPRGTFYRVQVGPIRDAKEAQQRCAELSEQKAECFVVRSH